MAKIEANGIIKRVGALEPIETKNGVIKIRQLVIEEDPNDKGFYDTICVKLIKDNAEKDYNVGQRVSLKASVRSKEWNNKYYNEVNCWYIRIEGSTENKWAQNAQTHEPQPQQQQTAKKEPEFSKTDDSLPF